MKAVGVVSALSLVLFDAGAARAGDRGGARLEVRATPTVAMSPASVLLVGQLRGNVDAESLYCPEVEWEWSDGTFSRFQEDCAPYEAGAAVEYRYSKRQSFRAPGEYLVTLRLRRNDRVLAEGSVTLVVHGAGGE